MSLFSKKERSSFALIDISSSSVAGALAHTAVGEQPTLYYTNRFPIERREQEDLTPAMLRTLHSVADDLIQKGAPLLRQETGSGHIDRVITSVGAPWQATKVRVETINALKPFTFTHALLSDTTQKNSAVPDGYIRSGESVIATLLNGYEMTHPFGKKATRVELVLLSSLLEKAVADRIEEMLRKTYHTHALTITAFAPLVYTVFRDVYQHEKDFLVLNVSGESTDCAFVKQAILVNVASTPHGSNELMRTADAIVHSKEWLAILAATLQEFSAQHALPRTLFLVADQESRDFLKDLVDAPMLRSLWLTDEPLTIIPVIPSHFTAFVKTRGSAEADVYLELLALYASKSLTLYPQVSS
jgi:hypothetical protein